MHPIHRTPRPLILAALCLLTAGLHAGEAPLGGIGFRGDGTGVFPPDCTPPTAFDGITPSTGSAGSGQAGKNLVWKFPLPNHSNGSPIVVGKRAFVMCAAGWPEGQDCMQLLCIDADTGALLWKRDVDEFAPMPQEHAKEARVVRTEYHRRIRRLNQLMFEYQSADKPKQAEFLKEAQSIGSGKIPHYFGAYSWAVGSAEQNLFGSDVGKKLESVCGYAPITWSPTCLDMTMPTPVSDGKRVFVYTGRRTVHAFGLDGKVLWQVWQSDGPYAGHWPEDIANSPLIADGKLLMYAFDHLWAYDLDTGTLVWRASSRARFRHGMGTPVLLDLPVSGQTGKTDAFAYLWTGDLVRLRDGKIMLSDVAYAMFGSYTTDRGDTLYISSMRENSVEWRTLKTKPRFGPTTMNKFAGVRALRFAYGAGDTVTCEELWCNPEVEFNSYPILDAGRLYDVTGVMLDAMTGKTLAKVGHGPLGRNGIILAAGHIYGMISATPARKTSKDHTSYARVRARDEAKASTGMPLEVLPALVTEPEQLRKVVAITGFQYHLNDYGWYSSHSCPFASGNRLFIRTFDYLYCFGDKAQPFVPSAAFSAVNGK